MPIPGPAPAASCSFILPEEGLVNIFCIKFFLPHLPTAISDLYPTQEESWKGKVEQENSHLPRAIVRQCSSFYCCGHLKLTLPIVFIFMGPPDTPFWAPVTAALLIHQCLSCGCPFPTPSVSVSYVPTPCHHLYTLPSLYCHGLIMLAETH